MGAATDRRIDKLIHLLVANGTVVVPGPKIAAEIGVTRKTVWEWIEKLRALGVEIKGHHATGYQLQRIPDVLTPSLLRAELAGLEIGHKIVHYFQADSTNSIAMELAAQGTPHGTVVVTEEQTAGRGRFGRTWYSEKSSGIYASIVLRPPLPPSAAPILTLAAGVAAHAAVSGATGLATDIRWPNDLLVNGKKICGILTEMRAELDRLHAVVLGIGINVNHRQMPPELAEIATSLRMEGGRVYPRGKIFVALLKEVEKHYRLLLAEGNGAIATRWEAASSFARGKRVTVHTRAEPFVATTAGLDGSGALRIRRDDGREELLVSGEVVEVK
ncbi:MAG TPA: biotin--[acetyl-CoA-carboxylase] ligase [Terracidiphilus sp.]|nr:biotin--[acetyl-CoA-carboxylase] ligase [Terracidiphilus sp.]HMD99291.1 biotin--[acetyl-CoA-carboxylase] ligase [Terriglobia bacterium]